MSIERQERAEISVLTSPEGQLLLRAIDTSLNSAGRRQVQKDILNYCQVPDRYSMFSNLVRGQLEGDDMEGRRTMTMDRIRLVDDFLVEHYGDPEKVRNLNIYFEFSPHGIEKNKVEEVREHYKNKMREMFVKGERNVFVIESPELDPAEPSGVVFPESASDYDIYIRAQGSRIIQMRNGLTPPSISTLIERKRLAIHLGINLTMNYSYAVMGAIDELNAEGYRIGLMYEEGIEMTDDMNRYALGILPVDVDGYKKHSKQMISNAKTRDKKLVKQIRDYVEGSDAEPTNIFVVRGPMHGGILEELPPSYLPQVSDATTSYYVEHEGPGLKAYKLVVVGEEPEESLWTAGHREYMEVVSRNTSKRFGI